MFGWSAVQPNCSRNVVLAWKQSVRSNWSNAKIRRPNLHLIFQNTTEPISTKIDSYRASTSAFHLGVQDPSVAYREASCIATFKVSECTWLNLYTVADTRWSAWFLLWAINILFDWSVLVFSLPHYLISCFSCFPTLPFFHPSSWPFTSFITTVG